MVQYDLFELNSVMNSKFSDISGVLKFNLGTFNKFEPIVLLSFSYLAGMARKNKKRKEE